MARGSPNHWSGYESPQPEHIKARAIGRVLKHLGFTEEAAKFLLKDGLDTVKNLARLDDDIVKQFVASCRKPGGGDDGNKVSTIAQMNLQLFVWIIKHHERISRKPDLSDFNLDWCLSFKAQIDLEKNWDNEICELDYPKPELTNAPKLLDSIADLLGRVRGSSGILLSKVIREELFCELFDTDPFGNSDDSPYASHDEEMIRRAPIILLEPGDNEEDHEPEEWERVGPFHPQHLIDRKKVYMILKRIFDKTPVWIHCKSIKNHDGRAFWFIIKQLLLGSDHVNVMTNALERRLKSLTYEGETKTWTFRKYRDAHKEIQEEARDLEKSGYAGIDKRSQVRHFLDGLKGTALDTCRNQIISDERLRSNFDAAASHVLDFINASPNLQARSASRHIAAVERDGGRGRGRGGGRGAGRGGRGRGRGSGMPAEADIERAIDRIRRKYFTGQAGYVPSDEYKKMTPAEQQAVFRCRGEKPGGRPPPAPARMAAAAGNPNVAHIAEIIHAIGALGRKFGEAELGPPDPSDGDTSDEPATKKAKSNRSNPALGRQKMLTWAPPER